MGSLPFKQAAVNEPFWTYAMSLPHPRTLLLENTFRLYKTQLNHVKLDFQREAVRKRSDLANVQLYQVEKLAES